MSHFERSGLRQNCPLQRATKDPWSVLPISQFKIANSPSHHKLLLLGSCLFLSSPRMCLQFLHISSHLSTDDLLYLICWLPILWRAGNTSGRNPCLLLQLWELRHCSLVGSPLTLSICPSILALGSRSALSCWPGHAHFWSGHTGENLWKQGIKIKCWDTWMTTLDRNLLIRWLDRHFFQHSSNVIQWEENSCLKDKFDSILSF